MVKMVTEELTRIDVKKDGDHIPKLPRASLAREVTLQDSPSSFQSQLRGGAESNKISEIFESSSTSSAPTTWQHNGGKLSTIQEQFMHLSEKDYQRSYSSECPLVFQSALSTTLSSFSKDETSYGLLEDSHQNNKKSIFRPRHDAASQLLEYDDMRSKNDSISMPNLLSRSSLDMNRLASDVKSNLSSDVQYIVSTSDATSSSTLNKADKHLESSIDDHVADVLGKSLDYPLNDDCSGDVMEGQAMQKSTIGNVNPLGSREHRSEGGKRRKDQEVKRSSLSDGTDRSELHSIYRHLKEHGRAFADLMFPLPGLKPYISRASDDDDIVALSQSDLILVKRRIKCAICAFGGNTSSTFGRTVSSNLSSIFRSKIDGRDLNLTQPKSSHQSNYEKQLTHRYHENLTRLSWEVEENPPVECGTLGRLLPVRHTREVMGVSTDDLDMQISKIESGLSQGNQDGEKHRINETPKAKYRCKLCGQPKQNHVCPYQQSLQRSIGTMSYPALNAFECSEPGELTQSLIEMNNFFNLLEENQQDILESVTSSPIRSLDCDSFISLNNITPKDNSPKKRPCSEINEESTPETEYLLSLKAKKRKITIQPSFVNEDVLSDDTLLLEKVEMKPEQYREISARGNLSSEKSYIYPTVPLTYTQRRCMSDSLYNLCKDRKALLDECSNVLCEAKKTENWDLAVAELITQVLIILHCPMDDRLFEGLRKYLMSMGISC